MAPIRHFSDLIVWQLAHAIRAEVFKLTDAPGFARDLKLRSQAEDAAHSVCRNIAEGFGGTHKEFARFLRIARRSLNEVQDAMEGALQKRYVGPPDLIPLRALLKRLYEALKRLLAYLERTPDPPRPAVSSGSSAGTPRNRRTPSPPRRIGSSSSSEIDER